MICDPVHIATVGRQGARGKFRHGSDVVDCVNCGSHVSGQMDQRGVEGGTGQGRRLWQQQEEDNKALASTD